MQRHAAKMDLRTCPVCPVQSMGMCETMRVDEILTRTRIDRAVRSFPVGYELYHQEMTNPSYFIIVEGWVALSATLEDGTNQILDFALPGGFLGVHPRSGAPSNHSAVCLTKTKALVMPRVRFDEAMAEDIGLMGHMLNIIACYQMRAYDHIQNISRRNSRSRLAHFLVGLFFRLQRAFPCVPGETIEIPLTLAHIGDALGLTAVHVSRTLGELRDEGLLHLSRRQLVVLAPDRLMEASGYAPPVGVPSAYAES